jgi:transcriptional regulator with XRE-family HTH domain
LELGREIRLQRLRRGWTLRRLGEASRLAPSTVHGLELGRTGSVATYARIVAALDLHLQVDLGAAARPPTRPTTDTVHAAMGELEAVRLRGFELEVAIDEPYQYFQFAGRADVVAWDERRRALLHIENRTQFPDLQAAAGAFNAKRAYLGRALAERLGVGRWASETHVMVVLWSAEVLHAMRLHEASFRSLCPDPPDAFAAWWDPTTSGQPTTRDQSTTRDRGRSLKADIEARARLATTLVIFDPTAPGRTRRWVGLDALRTIRARHRTYADAVRALREQGLA